MKFIILSISLILFISCSSNTTKDDNKLIMEFSSINKIEDTTQINKLALKYFIEGTKLHNQKKYKDAIIEYFDALRLDSSYAIHYAIAKSFRELKRYSLAEKHLLLALEQESNLLDALELLAEIQFLQGFINNDDNLKKAILTMEKVIEQKPSEKNKFMLARIYEYYDKKTAIDLYIELKDNNESQKVLYRLLDLYEETDNFTEYYELKKEYKETLLSTPTEFFDILIYYYLNLKSENISEILKFSEKHLDYEDMSNLLANYILYIADNKNEIFDEQAELVIGMNNSGYNTYHVLQYAFGILHYYLNDLSKSDSFFAKTLKMSESDDTYINQIGYFYYENKEYEKSVEYFKKIDEINNNLMISQIYSIYLDDYESALQYAKKSYEQDSTNINVLGNIANIYKYLEKNIESDFYYEQALNIDSTDAFINNNYAYSLVTRKKDLDKALKMSKIAVGKEPNNAAFLDTYGWILFNMGDLHNARIYLEEAAQKNDPGSEVFEHLGDIYIELNYLNKALDAYEEALEYENNERIINKIRKLKETR
jgi:tetratricopeptide (TPR) repeat protein